jgi:hypothetical protein
MTPDKETVRAAYIAEIGYDPFEDDANVTVEEAWVILLECRSYFVDFDDPNTVWSRHHY